MRTITHRELRNGSAEVLRQVEQGESFEVTNHGRKVAVIGPSNQDVVGELIERGEARAGHLDVEALRSLKRIRSDVTTDEMIADMRGSR